MLSAQYVQYIHDNLVMVMWPDSATVGKGVCGDINLLESAVARPFHSAFGKDAYPTILDKAVALFHSLNSNHPFHDGNKRTAVIALEHFLLANGFVPSLSNQEFYQLATSTASYRERGVLHNEALDQIREKLIAGTATFAEVRRQIANFPKEIEQERKERATFRRLAKRKVFATGKGRLLKAELGKADREGYQLETKLRSSIVRIYAAAVAMRQHIRRSPENQLITLP